MSTSATTGEVQLWFDGQPQTFNTGSQTINYPTLGASNWDGHTPNILNVNQYRTAGAYPGTVVTYQAAAKVATTLAAVQNSPTPGPPLLPPAIPPPAPPIPSPKPAGPPIPSPKPKHHRPMPASPARPATARFAAPVSSRTGQTVTLSAKKPSTRAPARYVWAVGRHTVGTKRTVHVTFGRAGLKHIRLTVINAAGHRSSVVHSVRVLRHRH